MSAPIQVTGADGRTLHAIAAGPPDGELLLMHHGTPGSAREIYPPNVEIAAERGIRLAAYTRPGAQGSDRHVGRTVADCAVDAAAVADALGAGRFYTLGGSGGGPHSLACAALLPDRVIAAASIAGVTPAGATGLDWGDWLDGMGEENHQEVAAARAGPEELESFLTTMAERMGAADGDRVVAALGDLVADADRAVLDSAYGEFVAANLRHSLSGGIWGWFDDDVALLLSGWGFELDSIARPVSVWHGDDDRFVPIAHGRWLAEHVPGVRAHLLEGHGHLSIMLGLLGEILDDLRAAGEAEA